MKITQVEPFILHVPVTGASIADSTNRVTHWGAPGVIVPTDAGTRGMENAQPSAKVRTRQAKTNSKGLRGSYVARGVSPAGAAYERQLQILRMRGDFYHLRWDGPEPMVGNGELDENGLLEVIASTPGNAGQCGKSVLDIEDGRLVGTWMLNDEKFDVSGRETAVRR